MKLLTAMSLLLAGCQALPAPEYKQEAQPPVVVEVEKPFVLDDSLPFVDGIPWHKLSSKVVLNAERDGKIIIVFLYDENGSELLYGMRVFTWGNQDVVRAVNKDFIFVGVNTSDRLKSNLITHGIDYYVNDILSGPNNSGVRRDLPATFFYFPKTATAYPKSFHGFMSPKRLVQTLQAMKENEETTGHR